VHRGTSEATSQSRSERCRGLLEMPDLLNSADDEHAFEIQPAGLIPKTRQAAWREKHARWRSFMNERERRHD